MIPPVNVRAAAVEAALDQWLGPNSWGRNIPFGQIRRNQMMAAITAAILEMEKHGFKVTGPEATEGMAEAWADAPGATTYAERAKEADFADWHERRVVMANTDWTAMHKAAPGWGDGV